MSGSTKDAALKAANEAIIGIKGGRADREECIAQLARAIRGGGVSLDDLGLNDYKQICSLLGVNGQIRIQELQILGFVVDDFIMRGKVSLLN